MSERRTIDEREYARLHELTGQDKEMLEQILSAAAALGIAFLLPPLRALGHYPQWSGFAIPGAGKCAHLTVDDGTRALCGVPVPFNAVTDLARGTQLCTGCASHAKLLGNKPFDLDVFGGAIRGVTPPAKPELPPPPPPKPRAPEPILTEPVIVAPPAPAVPSHATEPARASVSKPTPLPKRETKPAPAPVAAPTLFDVA